MLSKENRLQKDKDFAKVFRSSRPVYSGRIAVRTVKLSESRQNRVGFVISNKIDKRATRRNALKRRFRSVARELLPSMQKGHNIIVIIKQNYPFPYKVDEIRKDFSEACAKLKIM